MFDHITPLGQALEEAEEAIVTAEEHQGQVSDFIQYMLNEQARRLHFRLVTLAMVRRNAEYN